MVASPKRLRQLRTRKRLVSVMLLSTALWGCQQDAKPQAHNHLRRDCVDCHAEDFASVRHPQHVGVFPTRCAVCHLETSWHPSQRNHPWPLTGAHDKTTCFSCHTGSPARFEGTDKACVACHRTDFERSDFPGHEEFPDTCQDCHTTTAWRPAKRPPKKASTANIDHEGDSTAKTSAEQNALASAPRHAKQHASGRQVKNGHVGAPGTQVLEPSTATPRTSNASSVTPSSDVALKPSRKHPESKFPIASGDHSDIDCDTCHSEPGANAKSNTNCVQCHKRSHFDGRHARVGDYPKGPAPPNFCVQCHTTGRVRPIARR